MHKLSAIWIIFVFGLSAAFATPYIPSSCLSNIKKPEVLVSGASLARQSGNPWVSYTLSEESRESLHITCVSDTPNQWRWQEGEMKPKPKRIEKERLSTSPPRFFSNLTIDLSDNVNQPVDTNFSCHSVSGTHQYSEYATCIHVIYDYSISDLPLELRVYYGFHISCCLTLTYTAQVSCPVHLTVDLDKSKAQCSHHKANNVTCMDLDTCDSYVQPKNREKFCQGQIGGLKNNSRTHLPLHKQLFPMIVYCSKDGFMSKFFWETFLPLYPAVTTNFNTPKEVTFTDSFSKVDHSAAMKLDVLPYDIVLRITSEDVNHFAYINPKFQVLKARTQIADGEEVIFACITVKYLFMKGFTWKISNKTIDVSKYGDDFTSRSRNTYVSYVKVKLSIAEYSKHPIVTCAAPIWNAETMTEKHLKLSIDRPVKPNAFVSCENDKYASFVNCTCTYSGWPLPVISWEGIGVLNSNGSEASSQKDPNARNDSSSMSFQKLDNSYYTSINISCSAKNFVGTHIHSVTFEAPFTMIIIIIVVVVSLLIVIVSFTVGVMYSRYRTKLAETNQPCGLSPEEIQEFYSGASKFSATCETLMMPYNVEYEIPPDQLNLDGGIVLGSGQFGVVFQGTLGSVLVAVKTVKPTSDVIYFKSLLSELKILQYIGNHRNVVNLIGAITGKMKKREVFLVLDFCSRGCLLDVLKHGREQFVDFLNDTPEDKDENERLMVIYENQNNVRLTSMNLITFAAEIASALDHIESKNVIHGDIAARNVLVTEDMRAKICDFGLSKQLLHYAVYVQKIDCPLPLRWMAIESLKDMEFSLESDKWSYGILLWEIFSLGEIPYPGEIWGFESFQRLEGGYRLHKPKFANDSIHRIMLELWNASPKKRPSYQYVISGLKHEEELLT